MLRATSPSSADLLAFGSSGTLFYLSVFVVLPTYNEAENIERLLTDIRRNAPDAQILVIDDSSPDGTGKIAQRTGESLGGIEVITRAQKSGLGSAYRHGFDVALGLGADIVITMDSDFSHDPSVIPTMISLIGSGADLVVGSRYILGGGTRNWPLHRRILSRAANIYASSMLGLGVHDSTSGFRAYHASALTEIDPTTGEAEGYAFLTELIRRMARRGSVIKETPIIFADRLHGRSKMSGRIIAESIGLVTKWGLVYRISQVVGRSRRR